jgi:type III secretory pathway component EscV
MLFSLLREDRLYTNQTFTQFTLNAEYEGFKSFSAIFTEVHPQHIVRPCGTIAAGSCKLTVNLSKHLESLLASTELDENLFDGRSRFLDEAPLECPKVALTSLPGSGEDFFRLMLEDVTGVVTGSAASVSSATAQQLLGFKGESVIDNRVWIV